MQYMHFSITDKYFSLRAPLEYLCTQCISFWITRISMLIEMIDKTFWNLTSVACWHYAQLLCRTSFHNHRKNLATMKHTSYSIHLVTIIDMNTYVKIIICSKIIDLDFSYPSINLVRVLRNCKEQPHPLLHDTKI